MEKSAVNFVFHVVGDSDSQRAILRIHMQWSLQFFERTDISEYFPLENGVENQILCGSDRYLRLTCHQNYSLRHAAFLPRPRLWMLSDNFSGLETKHIVIVGAGWVKELVLIKSSCSLTRVMQNCWNLRGHCAQKTVQFWEFHGG